jgi:hypothetical protein
VANFLAVAAWFLVGMFAGIFPGVWLIVNDQFILGGLVVVAGYVLGGVAAEIVVWVIERDRT